MFKMLSKKGQVSTELGILVFVTLIISTIISYYYIVHYISCYNSSIPEKTANNTIGTLNNITRDYIKSLSICCIEE